MSSTVVLFDPQTRRVLEVFVGAVDVVRQSSDHYTWEGGSLRGFQDSEIVVLAGEPDIAIDDTLPEDLEEVESVGLPFEARVLDVLLEVADELPPGARNRIKSTLEDMRAVYE